MRRIVLAALGAPLAAFATLPAAAQLTTAAVTRADHVAYPPAFFDTFANAGTARALNGRTVAGVTWSSGLSSSPTALQVTASPGGTLTSGGNVNGYTFIAAPPAATTLTVFAGRNAYSELAWHLTSGAASANARVSLLMSTAGWALKMYDANAAAGSIAPGTNSLFSYGDDEVAMLVNGFTFTPYLNGFAVAAPIDMTTRLAPAGLIAMTGQHGIKSNGTSGAVVADGFGFGDPATRPMVLLEQGARVAQISADGSLTLNLSGTFFGAGPADAAHMRYSIVDLATRLPIAGFNRQPIIGYTVTGMRFTGATATIPASAVTAATSGVQTWVYRSDTTDGSEWPSHGGRIDAGQVLLAAGQSQDYYLLTGTATGFAGTATATGRAFFTEAFRTAGSASITPNTAVSARVNPIVADTNLAVLAAAVYAGSGQQMNVINAGQGGKTVIERNPGTDYWAAVVEGLLRSGNRVATGWEISGTGELERSNTVDYASTAAGVADWSAQTIRFWDSVEKIVGGPVKVVVSPVGVLWNKGDDASAQALRHAQWKLTQDYPTRFYEGGYAIDIQHAPGGDYTHYSAGGNRVNDIRNTNALTVMLGYSGARREAGGKLLTTGQSRTSTTVTLYVSDTEASSITVSPGAATNGDYRLGFDFSSSSSFSTYMIPTAVSVGTASGGSYPVTWTFAAVTGPVYVHCMYGLEPVGRNPGTSTTTGTQANATNTTIRADLANQASMLLSNYASGNKAAVRPLFTADATDTLVVS